VISDLNGRHDNYIRSLNSKLESALAQVKELTEKKRLVEVEMSELVVRAQTYDENEQKHVHKMQKFKANIAAKEHLAVLQLDVTNLKRQSPRLTTWRQANNKLTTSKQELGFKCRVSISRSVPHQPWHLCNTY
jgi:hypothetical protein